MKRFTPLLLACTLALPVTAWAQSASVTAASAATPSGVRVEGGDIQVRARVLEIDRAGRIVTLRGPNGQVATVTLPADMKNFDQIRVGDMVLVRYLLAVAARIEPAPKNDIRERIESNAASSAPAGSAPGAAGVRTVEVIATIQSIDHKARTLTLRGVHRTVKVAVPDGLDMTKVKTGDDVHAVFTEALVLAVEPAPKPAAKAR